MSPPRLEEFPEELLLHILADLGAISHFSLISASVTCKTLRRLAEAGIFENLTIQPPPENKWLVNPETSRFSQQTQETHNSLLAAIQSHERIRTTLVKTVRLDIPTRYEYAHYLQRELLLEILHHFPLLESLEIGIKPSPVHHFIDITLLDALNCHSTLRAFRMPGLNIQDSDWTAYLPLLSKGILRKLLLGPLILSSWSSPQTLRQLTGYYALDVEEIHWDIDAFQAPNEELLAINYGPSLRSLRISNPSTRTNGLMLQAFADRHPHLQSIDFLERATFATAWHPSSFWLNEDLPFRELLSRAAAQDLSQLKLTRCCYRGRVGILWGMTELEIRLMRYTERRESSWSLRAIGRARQTVETLVLDFASERSVSSFLEELSRQLETFIGLRTLTVIVPYKSISFLKLNVESPISDYFLSLARRLAGACAQLEEATIRDNLGVNNFVFVVDRELEILVAREG